MLTNPLSSLSPTPVAAVPATPGAATAPADPSGDGFAQLLGRAQEHRAAGGDADGADKAAAEAPPEAGCDSSGAQAAAAAAPSDPAQAGRHQANAKAALTLHGPAKAGGLDSKAGQDAAGATTDPALTATDASGGSTPDRPVGDPAGSAAPAGDAAAQQALLVPPAPAPWDNVALLAAWGAAPLAAASATPTTPAATALPGDAAAEANTTRQAEALPSSGAASVGPGLRRSPALPAEGAANSTSPADRRVDAKARAGAAPGSGLEAAATADATLGRAAAGDRDDTLSRVTSPAGQAATPGQAAPAASVDVSGTRSARPVSPLAPKADARALTAAGDTPAPATAGQGPAPLEGTGTKPGAPGAAIVSGTTDGDAAGATPRAGGHRASDNRLTPTAGPGRPRAEVSTAAAPQPGSAMPTPDLSTSSTRGDARAATSVPARADLPRALPTAVQGPPAAGVSGGLPVPAAADSVIEGTSDAPATPAVAASARPFAPRPGATAPRAALEVVGLGLLRSGASEAADRTEPRPGADPLTPALVNALPPSTTATQPASAVLAALHAASAAAANGLAHASAEGARAARAEPGPGRMASAEGPAATPAVNAGTLGWLAAAAGASGTPPTPASDGRLDATPGSPAFATELAAQVTTYVRAGLQQARLELNPAEMGPLTVQIQLDGNAARVHLAAENAATRQALEQAMPQLAGSLRESGLTLSGGGVFEQARQTPQQQSAMGQGGNGSGDRDAEGRGGRNGRGARGDAVGALAGVAAPAAARRPAGVVDLMA